MNQVSWDVPVCLWMNDAQHSEGLWCLQNKGTMILQNIRKCSSNDTMSHTTRPESSAKTLWVCQLSSLYLSEGKQQKLKQLNPIQHPLFEVLTVVLPNIWVICDEVPCHWVCGSQHIQGSCCFHLWGQQSIFHGLTALKSEGNIILHTVMNHLPSATVPEHSDLQMYTSFIPKTDMLSICYYCNCCSPAWTTSNLLQ